MTENNTYALIRVSTKDQNEERQVVAMTKLSIPKGNIVIEKESGKSMVRAKYHKLVKKLKANDTLYIENIDRLARDYDKILLEWQKLTQKGVIIKVLDTPILDIDQMGTDLFSRFIRDILIRVLAFQAESEWQKIKNRQAQGIAVAKANGKHLGRPKADYSADVLSVVEDWNNGKIDAQEAMRKLDYKRSYFYEVAGKVKEKELI